MYVYIGGVCQICNLLYFRFPNMGILHVTKKKVPDVLTRRILQGLRILDNAMLDNLEDDVEKNFQQSKVEGRSWRWRTRG